MPQAQPTSSHSDHQESLCELYEFIALASDILEPYELDGIAECQLMLWQAYENAEQIILAALPVRVAG